MDWMQVWAVTWRSIVAYVVLVSLARIMGSKLLSQMTFSDFVVGITIGAIAGSYIVARSRGLYVLIGPAVMSLCVVVASYAALKSQSFRKTLIGEPLVVVRNGKVMENSMKRARYNLDLLYAHLRSGGVFDMADVEFAVLETDGKLSILKKSQHLPVTPADIGLKTSYHGLAIALIKDGRVLDDNLAKANLDRSWLAKQLQARGIPDESSVFLAELNTDGSFYVDLKENPRT